MYSKAFRFILLAALLLTTLACGLGGLTSQKEAEPTEEPLIAVATAAVREDKVVTVVETVLVEKEVEAVVVGVPAPAEEPRDLPMRPRRGRHHRPVPWLQVDQVLPDGVEDRLVPGMEAELVEDVADVVLHRVLGDEQHVPDLLRKVSKVEVVRVPDHLLDVVRRLTRLTGKAKSSHGPRKAWFERVVSGPHGEPLVVIEVHVYSSPGTASGNTEAVRQ